MSGNSRLIAQLVMSALMVIPFWIFLFFMFFHGQAIHENVSKLLDTIMVQIVPVFCAVYGFWLGTSLSSAAKDHKQPNQPTTPTETSPNA